MIYDESSKALPVRELAALSFRRAMESPMLAVLSAGVALAIVLPMRINVIAIPPAILLPVAALLFWLRRSPPAAAIERYSKVIETRRRKGLPVGAMSRSFMALAGVLAFAFALGLLMVIPM